VAIIGGGQTGVSAAVGFLNAGFEVTLFSERDQPSLRDGGPATGTAVTFAVAQAAERELSLDDYASRAPRVTGQSTQIFSCSGADRKDGPDFDVTYGGIRAVGVDTRLKVDDRLNEFITRGGRFVVSAISGAAACARACCQLVEDAADPCEAGLKLGGQEASSGWW
jgi:hypothetical protein